MSSLSMAATPGEGGIRAPKHYERHQVIFFAADRAVAETPFTYLQWYGAISRHYCSRVPKDLRSIPLEPVPEIGTLDELKLAIKPVKRRMDKYRTGEWSAPQALEEAMLAELPSPYREDCRRELALRMGLAGVVAPTLADMQSLATGARCLAQMTKEFSRCMDVFGDMLGDGVINPKDEKHLAAFECGVDALVARALEAKRVARLRIAGQV